MPTPSPGYSITVRVEAPTDPAATARLSSVVAEAGGAITALDVAESHPNMLVVDVSCNASDVAHSESITKAIAALDGFSVRKVSDRTFLLHLGGKIEVTPKVPLKHRDDLSRAYTPGVARVCLAIAENPADARRLTIKRNTIAVVTDGSAVLGLGNIGPEASLPVMEGKAALFKRLRESTPGRFAWTLKIRTRSWRSSRRSLRSTVGSIWRTSPRHAASRSRSGSVPNWTSRSSTMINTAPLSWFWPR